MTRVLTAIMFLLAVSVYGATNTLDDAEYATVSAAVAGASQGDTIILPEDDVVWNDTLEISTPLNLIGAGQYSTYIENNASSGFGDYTPLIEVQLTNDVPCRISGLNISSPSWESKVISLQGPLHAIRIDNCYFNRGDHVIMFNYKERATGIVAGVIDHCTFRNPRQAFFVTDYRSGEHPDPIWGTANWNDSTVAIGTTNIPVVEDCTLFSDSEYSSAPSGDGSFIYGQGGGALCVRFSTLYNTTSGGGQFVDAHGDDYGTPYLSTKLYEFYGNTFSHDTLVPYRWLYLRGGQFIIYSNQFIGQAFSGDVVQLTKYFSDDTHVITNSHYWANEWIVGSTTNTTQGDQVDTRGDSYQQFVENQEYFLRAPEEGDNTYGYAAIPYPHPLISGGVENTNAPTITVDLSDLTRDIGQQAGFSVAVSGATPLTYYWFTNEVADSAASGSSYAVFPVTASSPTNLQVVITNDYGSATSRTAVLTIQANPVIGVSPTVWNYGLVEQGGSAQKIFVVTNSGSTTLSGGVTNLASPFSAVSGVPYSVSAGSSVNVLLQFAPIAGGKFTNTLTFGGGDTETVVIRGSAPTIHSNYTWSATNGVIEPPMVTVGDYIEQPTTTPDIDLGDQGRARYWFNIETNGDYYFTASTFAPSTASNSMFVSVDGPPVSGTSNIWTMATNADFTTIPISWWGSGAGGTNQFPTNFWSLSAGVHELRLYGREAGTKVRTINAKIQVDEEAPPAPVGPVDVQTLIITGE